MYSRQPSSRVEGRSSGTSYRDAGRRLQPPRGARSGLSRDVLAHVPHPGGRLTPIPATSRAKSSSFQLAVLPSRCFMQSDVGKGSVFISPEIMGALSRSL